MLSACRPVLPDKYFLKQDVYPSLFSRKHQFLKITELYKQFDYNIKFYGEDNAAKKIVDEICNY